MAKARRITQRIIPTGEAVARAADTLQQKTRKSGVIFMDFDFAKLSQDKIYDLVNGLVAPRPIAWITQYRYGGKNRCCAIQRL